MQSLRSFVTTFAVVGLFVGISSQAQAQVVQAGVQTVDFTATGATASYDHSVSGSGSWVQDKPSMSAVCYGFKASSSFQGNFVYSVTNTSINNVTTTVHIKISAKGYNDTLSNATPYSALSSISYKDTFTSSNTVHDAHGVAGTSGSYYDYDATNMVFTLAGSTTATSSGFFSGDATGED